MAVVEKEEERRRGSFRGTLTRDRRAVLIEIDYFISSSNNGFDIRW